MGADSARLTSDLRRHGLTVGSAFLVLAALAWWKERSVVAAGAAIVGGVHVLLALVKPVALGPFEKVWTRLALAMSRVTTPIIMAVIYFVIITPIGVLMRLVGKRPLTRIVTAKSLWVARPAGRQRSDLRRQF